MNLVSVGYFSKAHGLKGELILKVVQEFDEDKTNAVFIEHQGSKAPYFVSEIKNTPSGLILSLEEISSIEKARSFVGKQVFVDEKLIIESEDESEWIDFEVSDVNFGLLGKVISCSDNGVQTLLYLLYKNKELILPLVEEFIVEVNTDHKTLVYNAPDGLIDLYLGEEE
jgi:16S rRNA processing protein RimM